MRFLKKSQINPRNVADNSVAIQVTGEVTLDTTNVLLLPKGPTSNRPGEIGAATATAVTGHIRYNTDTDEVEVYQGTTATWRSLRFKESIGIILQSLGLGDSIDGGLTGETYFGPLNPPPNFVVDSNTEWATHGTVDTPGNQWTGANIMVFVENVQQLFSKNYDIIQNPAGKPVGWYVHFFEAPPDGKEIVVLHGFDR